jgi:riboflavin kinase / FMN adenylyltransferase
MKILHSLEKPADLSQPVILTIGNFDGVHLGHQAILNAVKTKGEIEKLPCALITFENHPSTILRPNHPIPLLTSIDHKLKLFQDLNIAIAIILNFTLPFSQQSAETFLKSVYRALPFRELILGHDAKLGNDRQGDSPVIHELARQLHFLLSFLPAVTSNGEAISSSRIRRAIQTADLKEGEKLLGRPYSVVGKALTSVGEAGAVHLSLKNLCAPPFGVYTVQLKTDAGAGVSASARTFPAIANVGVAPTVRHDHEPLLELHVLHPHPDFYGQIVEVTFLEFLRPEEIFPSRDALKEQIAKDISQAKTYFKIP